MSVEDHKAMKIIDDTISKVDGHYQIGPTLEAGSP